MSEPLSSSLRDVAWPRFLSAPDAELLERLYVPALSLAVRYDRCCAYFSSRVLALAARGFGKLIETLLAMDKTAPRPAIRLLVNEQLDPDDVEAMLATGDTSALERKLLRRLQTPVDALERDRLKMVAWLVKRGLMEVRVALPRRTGGIVHAKFGLITDAEGNTLSFMGSDNETAEAIVLNYEVLEVRPSWEDAAHAEYYRGEFEKLWADTHPHVMSMPLPEAVRLKLVKFAPKTAPVREPAASFEVARAAAVWRFLAAASYLSNGGATCDATAPTDPWPHQVRVITDTAEAFPSGRLLCDEVGLGKTIEAALVLRRLLAGRGVRRALLLVPAGLMRQWQEELREKGGLLIPQYDRGFLVQPDGSKEEMDAAKALSSVPVLLLSREWARLPANRALLLQSPAWDLVLMDEAHAARRKEQEETAFNQANLLLELLRELQLTGQAGGILLLSGTPMQIEPWEPWDLLSVLGVGGRWMSSFEPVRAYYGAIAKLSQGKMLGRQEQELVLSLVQSDGEFPHRDDTTRRLRLTKPNERPQLAAELRLGSPLGRGMHRNTRCTLREYFSIGLIETEPARREIRDDVYDYVSPDERDAYDAITGYIDRRYEALEQEKGGKGFVMTIYRRRAASSPLALRRSLERRLDAVGRLAEDRAVDAEELVDVRDDIRRDLDEAGPDETFDPALPKSAGAARQERREIADLLNRVEALGATDSKRDRFMATLEEVVADGRSALVFTEYTDTMDYLRDVVATSFGEQVACYSGRGGERLVSGEWVGVTKPEITAALGAGEIRVLVCTDAASEGLNLQAASALINYDLPWNPSRVEQRIGRIDRIGQKQPVIPIVNLFLKDSVDMRVYQALRLRCGLFEHFVGEMQPVLAIARDALRRNVRGPAQVEADIENAAEKIKSQPEVVGAFAPSRAEPRDRGTPGVTRQQLERALAMLSCPGSPVRAKALSPGRWRLSGLGRRSVEVALEAGALERYPDAVPLTLTSDVVARIAEKLASAAENTPLVIAEWKSGSHCAMEGRWTGSPSQRIDTFDKLVALLDAWDGRPAAPGIITNVEQNARRCAKKRVEAACAEAACKRRIALEQQVEAARLRLRRELAKHLRLFGRGDLNEIWKQRMERSETGDSRYRRAFDRLGGYVQWSEEELRQANDYAASGTGDQLFRMNVAPELEAALNDPRWTALETLQSAGQPRPSTASTDT
jgi:superfamily II DNA or RNA helicase